MLWDIDDMCRFFKVPKYTVYEWQKKAYGPRPIRVGRHLRWNPRTVWAWVAELEAGTSQPE